MNRTRLIFLILIGLVASGLQAETIQLLNGKTVEGDILARTDTSIRLSTSTGVITLPFSRIAPATPDMLEKANAAFTQQNFAEALKLSTILSFWQPDNVEVKELRQKALDAKGAAEKAKADLELEAQAQAAFVEASSKLTELAKQCEGLPTEEAHKRIVKFRDSLTEQRKAFSGTSTEASFVNTLNVLDKALSITGAEIAQKEANAKEHQRLYLNNLLAETAAAERAKIREREEARQREIERRQMAAMAAQEEAEQGMTSGEDADARYNAMFGSTDAMEHQVDIQTVKSGKAIGQVTCDKCFGTGYDKQKQSAFAASAVGMGGTFKASKSALKCERCGGSGYIVVHKLGLSR